jgi:hypothetical protein
MRTVVLTIALLSLLAGVAGAQGTLKMWYRGPFEGWVEVRNSPAPGYYYQPSANSAYPLNEQAYGSPIPCQKCGHTHYPGSSWCARCGAVCAGGGNREAPGTVYTQRRLPGAYYYKEQPHFRFVSPMRLGGTYQKYTRPYN